MALINIADILMMVEVIMLLINTAASCAILARRAYSRRSPHISVGDAPAFMGSRDYGSMIIVASDINVSAMLRG